MLARRTRLVRALSLLSPFALLACSTLIGLNDLQKADCVQGCGGSATGGVSGGTAPSGGSLFYMAGSPASGGSSATGGSGGTSVVAGGTSAGGSVSGSTSTGGTLPGGGLDAGGAGGEPPGSELCPGGPEPAPTWKEHWYEHTQPLTRVYYDDCIAMYFDADVDPAAKDWLVTFLDRSWSYSLATYGKMGNERIYVVVHQGRFFGGHSSTFIEASHDNHATIDMGSDVWNDGYYDLPAHLLGFLVDTEGAHTKFGAPKSDHYGNEGFPLIYKYDLYRALGLDQVASDALGQFSNISNSEPYASTFWFRDWFYPIWRDHGGAKTFVNYETLLQKYYPAGADMWMPTMNYGQYFHFMSGAAGTDLVPLARSAFMWHPDFDDEVATAKVDFPDIKY